MHKVSIITTYLGIPRFKSAENRYSTPLIAGRNCRAVRSTETANPQIPDLRFARPGNDEAAIDSPAFPLFTARQTAEAFNKSKGGGDGAGATIFAFAACVSTRCEKPFILAHNLR